MLRCPVCGRLTTPTADQRHTGGHLLRVSQRTRPGGNFLQRGGDTLVEQDATVGVTPHPGKHTRL